MVKTAPKTDDMFDPWLKEILNRKKKKIHEKNDDDLILLVGDTGSGKSNLALHMLEYYLGDRATTDLIGLNKDSIAKATRSVAQMDLPRSCLLDEANVGKRDSLSKFNKSMIDLFFAIRGLKIFWLWCNPSLDMMDKFFIKERISNVILVMKKGDKARPYYYFDQKSILAILKKYNTLEMGLLNKVRKKYALYRGWFKEYNGKLKKPYDEKKEERMLEKVNKFFEDWADSSDGWIKESEFFKLLGMKSKNTARKYRVDWLEKGLLDDSNYQQLNNGHHYYLKDAAEKFVDIIGEAQRKNIENLNNLNRKGGQNAK